MCQATNLMIRSSFLSFSLPQVNLLLQLLTFAVASHESHNSFFLSFSLSFSLPIITKNASDLTFLPFFLYRYYVYRLTDVHTERYTCIQSSITYIDKKQTPFDT